MELPKDSIKPAAEAVKAVAETVGRALGIIEGVGDFLNRLIGNAVTVGGDMLADQVAYWRKMRLLEFGVKFEKACADRNINPETMRPLSLSTTVRVLNEASMEESDEVQQLWADLLASAVDPTSSVTVKKMYVTLLKDVGPAEAAMLEMLGEFRAFQKFEMLPYADIPKRLREIESALNEIADRRWRKFSDAERTGAIVNLRRLGCIVLPISRAPSLNRVLQRLRVNTSGDWRRNEVELYQITPEGLNKVLNWLHQTDLVLGGLSSFVLPEKTTFYGANQFELGSVRVPELSITLTPLGAELVDACVAPSVGKSQTTSSANSET